MDPDPPHLELIKSPPVVVVDHHGNVLAEPTAEDEAAYHRVVAYWDARDLRERESPERRAAQAAAYRERVEHAQAERLAARLASGKPMCDATKKDGSRCTAVPIRGTARCFHHADEETREARAYGLALAEMGVGDDLGAELAARWTLAEVVDAVRRHTVLIELERQRRSVS